MRRSVLSLILLLATGCSKSDPQPVGTPPAPPPAAMALQPGMAKDPVCGKIVVAAQMPRETINGVLYYFCSEACEERAKAAAGRPTAGSPDVTAVDPIR